MLWYALILLGLAIFVAVKLADLSMSVRLLFWALRSSRPKASIQNLSPQRWRFVMTDKIATALAVALVLASTGFAIALVDRAALTPAGTYQADRDGDALMARMRSGID
jgi:hypothetical protein